MIAARAAADEVVGEQVPDMLGSIRKLLAELEREPKSATEPSWGIREETRAPIPTRHGRVDADVPRKRRSDGCLAPRSSRFVNSRSSVQIRVSAPLPTRDCARFGLPAGASSSRLAATLATSADVRGLNRIAAPDETRHLTSARR